MNGGTAINNKQTNKKTTSYTRFEASLTITKQYAVKNTKKLLLSLNEVTYFSFLIEIFITR